MAISNRKDVEVKREVKMVIAKDPFITTRRLAEVLHSRGIRSQSDKPLSYEYICKIVRKVHGEAIRDLDYGEIKNPYGANTSPIQSRFSKTV